ncbi:transposase [uncultured Nitrospira sp.]|uniref:transposase n=1 Tax=uncultured Nitrospira sp. TaxID=157176 RepID=UPI00314046C6
MDDLCRQLGVSEATFYVWKKKYAHLVMSELHRLRQFEDENSRLTQFGRSSWYRGFVGRIKRRCASGLVIELMTA